MKRLFITCMMFLIIVSILAVEVDSTAVQHNNQFNVPYIAATIISIIFTYITVLLGIKISKFKKILQLVKILFQDIEDSVIDNKISQTEVKEILNNIINIKQFFR